MKRLGFALYLIVSTVFLLACIEIGSFLILKARGAEAYLFYHHLEFRTSTPQKTDVDGDIEYGTIDPHLGYTHSTDERRVRELNSDFTWLDGFVIYAKDPTNLPWPVILALGGSTTDGVRIGHSWPEELARTLKERRIPGTVINGGIGGYSTNQELLKLLRDGIEFKPDIVISYSGINDRGKYSELPYPMVHSYQRKLLLTLTGNAKSTVLPSTMALLKSLGLSGGRSLNYTLGMKTARSQAEQYQHNMELMHAICQSQGCTFDAFIQPFAFYHSRYATILSREGKGAHYVNSVLALYEGITRLPATHSYVHDATQILEDADDVYENDGVHLNAKGDKVVGDYMFHFLEGRLR